MDLCKPCFGFFLDFNVSIEADTTPPIPLSVKCQSSVRECHRVALGGTGGVVGSMSL